MSFRNCPLGHPFRFLCEPKAHGSSPSGRAQTSLFDQVVEEPTNSLLNAPSKTVSDRPKIYSVAELSVRLRDTLQDKFPSFLIQGELADFKGIHRSGHLYCSLKDATAQIRMVMWRGALQKVPFDLKAGLEVIVTAKLDYYAGTGSLQIVAERLEPVGIGALQLKFEQLKAKLQLEGLFDVARKRPVPPLNWRVGIVTGKSTAALQDMLRLFRQRFPVAEVFLFHSAVQGDKAPAEICQAIDRANRYSLQAVKPLNVLIVGRGGGSYEDLFCFNDESVARAIAASKIPIVSAVGHEIDFTIADMVADKRAATPSHAAQETVPELSLWIDRLSELERRFIKQMQNKIADERYRIETLSNRLLAAAPQKRLAEQRRALLQYETRLSMLMKMALDRRKQQLARLATLFDALSPLKVLERGYSLAKVEGTEGSVELLKSVHQVKKGDLLSLRLSDGELKATVN